MDLLSHAGVEAKDWSAMIQRIAMISVHTGPLDTLGGKEAGGMNVYVRELVRAFGSIGVAADVFTRSQDSSTPRVRPLGNLGRVVALPAGPERPYDKNRVFDHLPEFVDGVLEWARSHDAHYDLLHGHYWLSGVAAEALRDEWRIPFVQMFHTLGELKNRVAQSSAELEPAFRIEQERRVIRTADRMIAATTLERDQMQAYYGADPMRVSVVPPGVNLEQFRPLPCAEARAHIGVPMDHRMVLFVGRIQPIKGIDTLIRAMALLWQRYPDMREGACVCIIGGDPGSQDGADVGGEMSRLKALREDLGVSNLVTFLGSKDQNTLVYYYSAAAVVVIPSRYESFGMVALEAMACGAPIIASDVGGLSFSVSEGFNGYLVPEGDAEALAHKIRLVLEQDSLRRQLSQQASRWVQRYAWPNIAREVLSVYEEARASVYQQSDVACH
jgi:D-inositol-3-phosphate glycosyltransferase